MKIFLSKKSNFIWVILLALGIGAAGCARAEEDNEDVVVVSDSTPGYTYNLIAVKRSDVILSKVLSCQYVQTKEQEVSFSEGGKVIEKIFVREGDYVNVGDVLAEVSVGSLEEDIAALEYKIKREELEKSYLDAHEQFELTDSYYRMAFHSSHEEEDVEEQEKRDADIRESYSNQKEDYEDDLEFDRAELDKLKNELAGSRLYATMSGMVDTVKRDLEGTTSQKGEVIMTIIDGKEGIFEMEEAEYAQYFHENEPVRLDISYGEAKGAYEIMPYQMDSWDEKQFFIVSDGPENDGIEVKTTGSVYVVLDKRENVLSLPNECIYKADNKSYVYVLDEQDMKKVCWIETGLVGDKNTEILSGLNEGDMVVKR